jgi:glutathione S-transferase
MLELFQAEWCPHSGKVRQRLTELGVDFVARQVAADPDSRRGLRDEVGEIEIPVARTEDGRTLAGEEEILAYLDERYGSRRAADADAHRAKALDKAGLPE